MSVPLQNFIYRSSVHEHLLRFRSNREKTNMPYDIWRPTKDSVFALRDFSVLRGGPRSATISEHTHAEAQVTVRFRPSKTHNSKKLAAYANLYASKQPHSGGWEEGWHVLVFQFSPQMLEQAAEELFGSGRFEIRPFNARRETLFEEAARAMLQEYENPENMSRFYAESMGHVVAAHILRVHSETRSLLITRNGLSTAQLLVVRRYIDERIEAGFNVIELASAVGLGPQQFAEKLRLATGKSPWRYVQAQRISRAQRMLSTGRMPIVEISGMLGFASQSHFTNLFRNHLGVTPNAYRKMSR